MNKDELQALKDRYASPDDFELGYMNAFTTAVFKDIQELIAAVEELQAELAEMKEEDEQLQSVWDMVISEKCPGDEIHCTCVPILRIEIADLRKQLETANDQNWNLERIIDGYRSGYKELKDDFAETRIRLEAGLAEAQYSRLELVEQIATMQSDWGKCEAKLATLQAENERLRKAIDLFGDQPPDCSQYWELGK